MNNPQEVPVIKKDKRVLKWALILGIVIVFNLFVNYSISLVYKQPQYDAFCPTEKYNKQYVDKTACVADGGMWTENTVPPVPDNQYSKPVPAQPVVSGYCNPTYTCGKAFNTAESLYNRNVFIILVIFGILALVIAVYLSGISVISLGFSFGGVISLFIGSIRYWSDMNDILRVVVLGLALAILVWLAVKKFNDK